MYNYKRKLPTSGEVKDKAVIEETYKHHCDCVRHLIMKYDDVRDKPETNVGFQDVATSY